MNSINKRLPQLFPNIPLAVLKDLKFDKEAIFSVTNQKIADEICRKLLSIRGISPSCRVTDATACIGGNVFSFVKNFKKINAIEINKERYEMLKNNLTILDENYLNFDKSRVNLINGNCLDYILPDEFGNTLIDQDILFIDPPWGGLNYKENDIMDLYLEDSKGVKMELFDIIKKLNGYTKYIVLKVPINYNLNNILTIKNSYKVEHIKSYIKPNSMFIIILSQIY